MGLFIVRRRHRLLGLVLLVLAVATWGLWLAHSGRATDYGDTVPVDGSSTAPPAVTSGVAAVAARSRAATPRQGSASSAVTKDPATVPPASTSAVQASAAASRTAAAGSQRGSRSGLAGISTPTAFAQRVATVLLSYDSGTDFAARTSSMMAVAALPPLGNPAELSADLTRYTPDQAVTGEGVSVQFSVDRVSVSTWAAARIAQLHLPDGSFGVDVTGRQIITRSGTDPVSVSVTLGMTGACPPALVQCELDRVFPQTVQQELDR